MTTATQQRPSVASFVRAVPVEDISVAKGGDGRTVQAYAAVFNKTVRVANDFYYVASSLWEDEFGTYDELIRGSAFDKSLSEHKADYFKCLFNHGMDIFKMPAPQFSLPLGVPTVVKADAKGLYTETRYSSTPLADEVLQLVKDGAITGMSFSGKILDTIVHRAEREGDVDLLERTTIALREFGPCVFPTFEAANIVGTRAEDIASQITGLGTDERESLIELLRTTPARSAADAPAAGTEGPGPDGGTEGTPAPAADEAPEPQGPSMAMLRAAHEQRKRHVL